MPQKNYLAFCYKFFLQQVHLINPKIILCLGHDVRKSLVDSSSSFSQWKPKSISFKKLYQSPNNNFVINIHNRELGERRFISIPHPCDNRNFTESYIQKILLKMEY